MSCPVGLNWPFSAPVQLIEQVDQVLEASSEGEFSDWLFSLANQCREKQKGAKLAVQLISVLVCLKVLVVCGFAQCTIAEVFVCDFVSKTSSDF